MTFDLKQAMRGYEIEVEHIAAQLIRNGTAPWSAIEQAKEIVRERRRDAAKREAVRRSGADERSAALPETEAEKLCDIDGEDDLCHRNI